MSRFLPLLSFIFPVVLTACSSVPDLPHEEVIARAVLAGQRMQSASFLATLDGAYVDTASDRTVSGELTITGVVDTVHDALSSVIEAAFQWGNPQQQNEVDALAHFVSVGDAQIYITIDSLSQSPADPHSPIAPFARLQKRWLQFPVQQSGGALDISSDPLMLASQAAMVTVIQEFHPEKIHDRMSYHYGVILDQSKFSDMFGDSNVAATGELWIDAETFYITRVQWDIQEIPMFTGALDAKIDITFWDHDTQQAIDIPSEAIMLDDKILDPWRASSSVNASTASSSLLLQSISGSTIPFP